MQPIDAITLHHLAGELDLKLADGKINKIQQASHYELLIHIWVGGESGRQKLYINIRPEYSFSALLEDSSFLSFPDKALNFCMLLRKHLTSARIRQISTLPDERILNILMENFNELGQKVYPVLSIELMGKNSNIILYDEELKLITGSAHGVSESMSRHREVSAGYPYVPPPKPPGEPIRFASRFEVVQAIETAIERGENPEDLLVRTWSGIGKYSLRDIFSCYTDTNKAYDAICELFQGVHLFPAIKRDFSRFSLSGKHRQEEKEWLPMGSINRMIREFYLTHLLEERLKSMRQQFQKILKNEEKKLLRRRHEFKKSDSGTVAALKKAGDLLTIASSHNLKLGRVDSWVHEDADSRKEQRRQGFYTEINDAAEQHIDEEYAPQGPKCQHALLGKRELDLLDFESDQTVTVEIDPLLSLAENAQFYYKRYKKAKSRENMALQTIEQLDNRIAFIHELSAAVDLAQSEEDLQAVREDLEREGWIKPLAEKKRGTKKVPSQPLSVTSSDGFKILVGRNSIQNEQIVGKLSRSDDLWLHAHLVSGSHVLVRSEKKEIPDRTLEEAALLAAWFSQARGSVNVPVVYTRIQHVRKIPDSYPGHVTYTHEKAVNVTPEDSVIRQLLLVQCDS